MAIIGSYERVGICGFCGHDIVSDVTEVWDGKKRGEYSCNDVNLYETNQTNIISDSLLF